jgi:hypothetical protein
MSTAAEKASFEFKAPHLTGEHKVNTAAVTATASRVSLFGHLSAADTPAFPRGYCQLTVKVSGGNTAYIVLKDGTAAASVTTSTGYPVASGEERSWWINGETENDLEAICAATQTATIHWYVSSKRF